MSLDFAYYGVGNHFLFEKIRNGESYGVLYLWCVVSEDIVVI